MTQRKTEYTKLNYNSRDTEITCSFTGYRPQKLSFGFNENHPDCIRLKKVLRSEIIKLIDSGYRYFQSGMALGIDMICAEIVLELKEQYPHIMLFAIIPCENQTAGWNDSSISRYNNILDKSDGSFLVTSGPYEKGCMQKRNRYLVDTAGALLAVFDGKKGGTMNTVAYADKMGKKLVVIDPARFVRIEFFSQLNFDL